jgi:hypothetical protein
MAVITIIPKFKRGELNALIDGKKARIIEAIISRLRFIGETFVTNARNNGSYKDRTGNLRSSIGYVILVNGVQIEQDFKSVSGGKSGPGKASQVIEQLRTKFSSGIVLIVVAGMEYAAAVESRGLDVLTSSSKIAENDLKIAFQKLQSKVSKAA